MTDQNKWYYDQIIVMQRVNNRRFSDFEKSFLRSCSLVFDKGGRLSKAQVESLRKIYERITDPKRGRF